VGARRVWGQVQRYPSNFIPYLFSIETVLKNYIKALWWYSSVIPALERLRKEDYKFKASLAT
jgi:hypothetical protein